MGKPIILQMRIRDRLVAMVSEIRDDTVERERKRRREEALVAAGLEQRENAARAFIDGASSRVGGARVHLGSDGQIHESDEESSADRVERPRRRRKKPKMEAVLGRLLDTTSARIAESERLEFEKMKFEKELELRRMDYELRMKQMEQSNLHFEKQMEFKMRKLEMMLKDKLS
jgi:hypothetical protein